MPFSLNFPGTVLGGRLIVDAGLFVVQHKCIIANAAGHDGAAGQRRVIVNEELLQDLIDEAEDEWFEQKHRLNVAFYKLNESGREKALERIEELAEIPKYQDLAQIKIIEETEAQTQALEDRMKENEARAYEKLKRSWENSHLAPPAGDSTQSAGTGDENDPE